MTATIPSAAPPAPQAPPPAPEAAPAALSAPAATTPEAPRDPSTGQFKPRIAPIKLPGVQSRSLGTGKTLAQEIDESRASEPADGAAPDPTPGTDPDPNAPAPAAKLKFDGREFSTPEEVTAYAEVQLRTARNSQAAASRNAQLQANRAKAEIEQQYTERLAALEQRILQPAAAANADPAASADAAAEQQFWAEILQARQTAATLADPAARAREEMLINYAETNFLLEKRFNDLTTKLDARFQPFEMTREQSTQLAAAESLFESVAHFSHPDGSPQFPEMLDETDAEGVVQIWHAQTRGMKAEDRHDPKQVVLATLAYRALKAEMTKGQQPAPQPPTPPRLPAPPAPRPAASGAVLQQSNINGSRTSLPGGQILPGVWGRGSR